MLKKINKKNKNVTILESSGRDSVYLLNEEKELLKKNIADLEKTIKQSKETEEINAKLKLLVEINTYITNTLDKEEILKRILNQIKQLLNCESSSILLVDEEINRLKFAFLSEDEEGKALGEVSLKMGEGIAGSVWENGMPILINNAHNDPRFSNTADKKLKIFTRSIIAVPLTVNGLIIGVMEVINRIEGSFSPFDLQMLQYLSTQSAIAIKNADLYEMATKDGMTRLYIHKYFRERLFEEWKRSQRFGHSLSLVMFDIDHFKTFNDTYGHQAGDRVLKEVAKVIGNNSRGEDIPSRYGGEEFAVILPETTGQNALIFAERIRQFIEQLKIEYKNNALTVTISGGIASIPEMKPSDIEEFIGMADKALYYSKENGRNKLTVFNQNEAEYQK